MLEAKGYIFLDANFRVKTGELDLVMRHKETIVFVEVRERRNESYGRGFETVNGEKQRKLGLAAAYYVKLKNLAKVPLRFDVVSFGPRGAEHIPNAFVPPAGRFTI